MLLIHFQIQDMDCETCVTFLNKTLKKELHGIVKSTFSIVGQKGHIEFKPDVIGVRDIIEFITVNIYSVIWLIQALEKYIAFNYN